MPCRVFSYVSRSSKFRSLIFLSCTRVLLGSFLMGYDLPSNLASVTMPFCVHFMPLSVDSILMVLAASDISGWTSGIHAPDVACAPGGAGPTRFVLTVPSTGFHPRGP